MIRNIFLITLLIFGFSLISEAQDKTSIDLMEQYFSKRAASSHSSTKKFSDEEQKELDVLYKDLVSDYPNSYQRYLISYVNSGYDNSKKNDLFLAYEKNPKDSKVLKYMLAYYIINDDKIKQQEFVKKTDDFYSKNHWDYYRDLIVTTKKGIIITSSQEDTYPLMAASMLYGIGSDIKIICLDFLQNDSYRKRVQTMVGMPDITFLGKEKYFIAELLKNTNKKLVISSTVNQSYMTQVETTVFLTGLAYEYKCKSQRKALDEYWNRIKIKNLGTIKLNSWKERALYTNYIPPLLTLYQLKLNVNETDNLLRKAILTLAKIVKKEDDVGKILADYEND